MGAADAKRTGVWNAGSRVLQKEQDFYELTRAYLQRARAQGVVHAEVFVDPQAHLERGIALSTLFEGIKRAVDEEVQVSCFLIVCFLREKSAEEAMKLLNDLVPYIEYEGPLAICAP